ncbi:hypothetical protein AF72_01230 [Xylella taiwanensis]|uniref:Uncharacterized protein n=1 Tax=Xylella taiwanensis TaxID=1444770 RepID=Z9JLE8_9GAMM|nr:hypothetical protein AF72_01230 [Xylella taiwanensis]
MHFHTDAIQRLNLEIDVYALRLLEWLEGSIQHIRPRIESCMYRSSTLG